MSITRAETKKVKALHTKKGRRSQGRYIAEGVRLLEEAQRMRVRPLDLYFAPSSLSERGLRLVRYFHKSGAAATEVKSTDLDRMAGATTPQGILGVFRTPESNLSKLGRAKLRNILIVENVSDPGNVGTLLRTAAAFDFDLVVLVGSCAEPFAPKVVRASVGAVFGMPVATAELNELSEWLQSRKVQVIAAALEGKMRLAAALRECGESKMAVAIGSEADGLSDRFMSRADYLVRIDHSRRVESLNSAVAGAIIMRECFEQRIRRQE